jgi:hypothetical protein
MDYFSGYRLSHNEIRGGEQEIGKGNFSWNIVKSGIKHNKTNQPTKLSISKN